MRAERELRSAGLTLIEVLVALSVLSIIATAIISSLAVTVRLNRDASVDVDYSRVVRNAMERSAIFYSDPANWTDSEVQNEADLNTFVTTLNPDCRAELVDPMGIDLLDFSDSVVVVRITCGGGDGRLAAQVFEQEFPKP